MDGGLPILSVYNESGQQVAYYSYSDAWGNHTAYVTTTAIEGAQYNPFRYRGYYYDTDLGMYYLQSRYYDAKICRFINADGYVSTGQGILGNNMFAYCGNNPVMRVDPTGEAWYNDLYDLVNTIVGFFNRTSTLTAVGALAVAAVQGRWSDIKQDLDEGCFNPFNQDESTALKAEVLSFYKGSTVVRQNIVGTCSIFGTIWAEKGISGEDLNHEFGHSVQERILGKKYIFTIAVPSAANYFYGSTVDRDYYSLPWERTADFLGGINRTCGYKQYSMEWAVFENMMGPIVIPLYYAFGY